MTNNKPQTPNSKLQILMLGLLLFALTGCNFLQIPLREPLRGTCECPYDRDRSGNLCRDKSAYSRPGGTQPTCYIGEGSTTLPNDPLALGNPSNATTDPNNRTNYLMKKPQYVLSYNSQTGTANWASWQLNLAWLGSIDRQNDFRPDDTLPPGFYRVTPDDYRGSGYDRGHLIPSADRTGNTADNSATFVMTNMIPQTAANNREVWRKLEEYCRELVQQGKQLYIFAGPEGSKKTIAKGKVTVPQYTWKVIVILDRSESTLTEKTRTIAVRVPNTEDIADRDWREYLVSIDVLETATGYDFLSNVPQNVQQAIEPRVGN
jgi:endonuclease G, mitochondrial